MNELLDWPLLIIGLALYPALVIAWVRGPRPAAFAAGAAVAPHHRP